MLVEGARNMTEAFICSQKTRKKALKLAISEIKLYCSKTTEEEKVRVIWQQ